MENIDRKQVDRMIELLDGVNTEESKQLSEILKNEDIIPKLYQYAYVESMYNLLCKFKSIDEFMEKVKYGYSDEKYWLGKEKPFNAVVQFLTKAHHRQDEICDFQDSILADKSTGRCGDEDHYEKTDADLSILTEDEQKIFDKINDEKGWFEAHEHFIDKFNPDNQELHLILNFNDDETKVSKSDGYYVCGSCLENIQENSEGNISCDLDMVEDSD